MEYFGEQLVNGIIVGGVYALIALGYKQVDAAKAVREVALKNKDAGTEELVRLALKSLV